MILVSLKWVVLKSENNFNVKGLQRIECIILCNEANLGLNFANHALHCTEDSNFTSYIKSLIITQLNVNSF
jgi:hypothetical protein